MVRKVIRSAKRDYWRQFCNGIGERIDICELGEMGGVKIDRNIPVIDEGKYITLESEKAEVLAKAFVRIHRNSNISEDMNKKREQDIMVQKRSSECTFDEDLTLYELKQVLTGSRNTSQERMIFVTR